MKKTLHKPITSVAKKIEEARKALFIRVVEESTGYKLVSEYRFHPIRKFKADFAIIKQKVLIECEGGIYTGGAHGSITGIIRDIEKYNLATKTGWKVLRYTPENLYKAIDDLIEMKEILK